MNKKLISALFVGALLLGSTSALTSCKDYDDDIDNLQTQIDKAALASDVEALKTELTSAEATATAAKTSAEAAVATATAANDAVALKAAQTDLDAAVDRIAALETEMSKLTDFEAELQAAVDDEIASLKTEFDTLKTEIENTIGTMVTSVSVFGSFRNGDFTPESGVLIPVTGTQVANVFGKTPAADKTVTYTKGTSINFPVGLVVRINPTNYTPSTSDIKLVNSKGVDLSSVLEVVSVEKYDGLLTARSVGNGTGLWSVGFQLKDGKTEADLQALTLTSGSDLLSASASVLSTRSSNEVPVAFAVAVNNTSDDTRSVVSSYDVLVPETATYEGASSLSSILVNDVAISNVHNRYSSTETSTTDLDGGKTITPWEQIWNSPFTTTTTGDDRQDKSLIMATLGEEIPISFENLPNVQYYYVTLDTKNSVDSDNSEINAWNSYTYTGLNTIYSAADGSSVSVTKMGKTEDIIGFRIYAVNFDGTLADPDGIAFYAYVGEESNVGTATGDIVPTNATSNTSAAISVSGTFLTGGDFTQSVALGATGAITFANGVSAGYALYKADGTTAATDWSNVGSVKITIGDPTAWEDGTTSTAQIIGKKNGTPFNIINVTLTKKLPTTFPSSFSWKASQLVDGVYTCYLTPVNGWTTATNASGYKALENVCNGLTSDGNYKFVIANAAYNATDAAYTDDLDVTATGTVSPYAYNLSVLTPLIDSSTAHQMKIYYTYKGISSSTTSADVDVLGQTVSIKFACVLNTSLETYAWIQKVTGSGTTAVYTDMNNVTYGTTGAISAEYLKGTNSFDNTFTGLFKDLDVNYPGGITATLKSDETGTVDYFNASYSNDSIRFAPLSATTVPTADVASTLTLKVIDAFGHTNTYSLPVTVKKP